MTYIHKLIKVGNVLGMCLPQAYIQFYGIKRGDYCVAEVTQDGFLLLKFFDPNKRPDLLEKIEKVININ